MALLSAPPPGARIECRGEQWLVRRTEPAGSGFAIHCIGISGITKRKPWVFWNELDDITLVRPEDTRLEPDTSANHTNSRLFLEALIRTAQPDTTRITLGHQAAADSQPIQHEPTLKALENIRPSILIADAVGAGKTIEVGILLTELIQRGAGERILVLTQRSILEQFQRELWSRFTIPLIRVDSTHVARLREELPLNKNPLHHYDKVIMSIDTLKNDGRYRNYVEQSQWDIVVIDECHHVAGDTTLNAKLATRLSECTKALILTSATPHNGKPKNFANLIRLLDPTAIADDEAMQQDDFNAWFIRRPRRDFLSDLPYDFRDERKAPFTLTPAEQALLEVLHNASFATLDERRTQRNHLFRYTLLKSFLSSPDACRDTITQRLERLHKKAEDDKINDQQIADAELLQDILENIEDIIDQTPSKMRQLAETLTSIGIGPRSAVRAIVFIERKVTLDRLHTYLKETLKLGDDQIVILDGGMPDHEQMAIVDRFGRQEEKVRLLLTTDVASEGVNLHDACHHLVHFDIPWSPTTIEQRNGRIDRYGQQHRPVVYYLCAETTHDDLRGDLLIYDKLVEKAARIHRDLGDDPSRLTGLFSADAEDSAITNGLSSGIAADAILENPFDTAGFDLAGFLGGGAHIRTETIAERPLLYTSNERLFKDLALLYELEYELDGNIFDIKVPESDIQALKATLPTEARPKDWNHLRASLSTSVIKQNITQSRAKARKNDTSPWPDIHLLWEQHPLMELMLERAIQAVDRNKAPLITTPSAPNAKLFLFQAVLSSAQGKALRTAWLTIDLTTSDGKTGTDLAAALTEHGIAPGDRWPNAGSPSAERVKSLERLIPLAVQKANAMVNTLRNDHIQAAAPRTAAAIARLDAWRDKSTRQLLTLKESYEAKALTPQIARVDKQIRDIDATYTRHRATIEVTLQPEQHASLRLAAVLAGGNS